MRAALTKPRRHMKVQRISRELSNLISVSFPAFDHDDVVSEDCLDFCIRRIASCALFKVVGNLFEFRIEAPPCFPAERSPCTSVSPDTRRAKAVSSLPCLALSSENARATSSKLRPLRSSANACCTLEYFSHCRASWLGAHAHSAGIRRV